MLTRVSQRLAAEGLQVDTEVLHGSPHQAITDAAKPGDVIVMTSHGRGGVKRWLLDSVAEKLIRDGSSSVVLVPARQQREDGRDTNHPDEKGGVSPASQEGDAERAGRGDVEHVR
jgi:hypothetical protein